VKIPGNNPEKRVEDSRLAYIRYKITPWELRKGSSYD
jgi:hypothetical protein